MHPKKSTTLVLSATDIEKIVFEVGLDEIMDQLIGRLYEAFKNFDPAKIQIPIRSGFHYEEPENGLIEWMPLYEAGKQVFMKMVGYHPMNPEKYQLPTIISTISVYDTATGHLKGITDGVFLTALRTGASSAVATKALALPESSVLGLIGCGAQAVTQLHALSRVYNLKEVHYFDTDKNTRASFIDRVNTLNLPVKFVPSEIADIVSEADIICTATSIEIGAGPLFSGVDSKPWLHINAVGSDFPGKTELPMDFLEKSFVCPDFIGQAMQEGECQQLQPHQIAPDLFTVIKEEEKFLHIQNKRTVFDSTGLSLEDQVVMDLFMEYAIQNGFGQEIEIEKMEADAKNPYHFISQAQRQAIDNLMKIENK